MPCLAALAAASLAAACTGEGAKPQPCLATEECPTAARCLQQVCVANGAPVAVISAPAAPPEVNALLTLDGSGSSDPDAPLDALTSHRWTFASIDAPCEAPAVAGTSPQAVVRFACAGRFEAQLVVTDQLSASSVPARRELRVVPRASPALVSAGPDVELGHRCAGDPLRCAPDAEVQLAATAASGQGAVSYRWSVVPPADRPLGEGRRVTFVPGADAAAPIAMVETDGGAISGEWVFAVEARDDAGVLGTAATRVVVGNEPPALAAAVREFAHVFNPVASQFSVSDALEVTVLDPDGDPVPDRAVLLRHTGDGGGVFTGEDLGDRIGFNVIVPSSLGAQYLIGAPGLSRTIELSVRDVNGAPASAVWPVVVGNRQPFEVAASPTVATDHAFDPVALRYVASAELSTWSDPDGDPLVQEGATGDPICASFRVLDGRLVVDCALDFLGVAAAANFAADHAVTQRVRDPWSTASRTAVTQVTIRNRAPRVDTTRPEGIATACAVTSSCCSREPIFPHECLAYDASFGSATFVLAGRFFDDDGDPLAITAAPSPVMTYALPPVGVPESCTLGVTLRARLACGETATDDLSVTASDGQLASTGIIPLSRACAVP